jgi:glycosyltransferase involved in cell wall biosynthesis
MLVSGTGINGAIVHSLLLMRFLASRGHSILLLHRPDAWIAAQPGLENVDRFATSFGRSPRELIRVTRTINTFDPQVLHTHMSSAHTYGMLTRILSRRPVVATAHSQSLQLHWCFNNIVIATSDAAADHHHRTNLVRRAALRTQPNFIDPKAFPVPSPVQRQAARASLGIADDAFVVGSVGFIDGRKNQIDLVHALGGLVRSVPNARLLLVGGHNTDYMADLLRIADALGVREHLVMTGVRTDIAHLLAAMDVYALVSRKESGPLSVLEAMATGLPVLATDVGMLPEFVRDGSGGHIVKVGDTHAMTEKLVALAQDSARRTAMGVAAHAIVTGDYSIDRIGPQTEAILAEAAAQRNRPLLGFVAGLVGRQKGH